MDLLTLIREAFRCNRCWMIQKATRGQSTENKRLCSALNRRSVLTLTTTTKAQGTSRKRRQKEFKSQTLGKGALKCYLLVRTWLSHLWTRSSCGYLHRHCTRSNQSKFPNGWRRGSRGLIHIGEAISSWWLLKEGDSFSLWLWALVDGLRAHHHVHAGSTNWIP